MKSNKMMNIAGVLLVLVLLTTCGLSKTYAKYTTQASGRDQARVAKWGVAVTVEGDGIFSTAYKSDGGGISITDYADEAEFLVAAKTLSLDYKSETSTKVIAPGTSGTLCNIKIQGTPEVAVQIIATGQLKTNAGVNASVHGWIAGGEEYFPLIFTIDGKDYYIGNDGIKSIAELCTRISEAVSALSAQYAPNTNLANVMNGEDKLNDLVITWRWNFKHPTVNDPLNPGYPYYTNGKDTALTDPSNAVSTMEFDLNVQVVQID